jgi:N-methylhydantoinase A
LANHGAIRLAVDIGGTFTDVVVAGPDGHMAQVKVLSTPNDYSLGILAGIGALLERTGYAPESVVDLVHATTVATNTILEHKGARTALVTTAGFRDILEMRRLRIPVLYDLQYRKPPPLVPRRLRLEVGGRLGPRGQEWEPLDQRDVDAAAQQLAAAEVESVAICLLHSYANPEHEERLAQSLRRALGEHVFVSCSHEILPEIREYERTSTTVVNAYVGPVVERYLSSLAERLRDARIGGGVHIMLSSGGVMTVDAARRKPAYLVESGPAAGVIACARVAERSGHENVISFDMGGTTAKAAIIEGGKVGKTTEYEVGAGINLSSKLVKGGGYPVKLPFIDVSEIGAGGGSLVSVDASRRITVGPESAGASPGPICYGLGGKHPTLTDVLVALGYINPHAIAGGAIALDAEQAKRILERDVARPLGMTLHEMAFGVLMLACATMTRAVKAVSTYRGRDPRDFVLVAFGGNGPVVAAQVARALQMPRVLIPPAPGVFSAVGLLFSDMENQLVRTVLGLADSATTARMAVVFEEMAAEASASITAGGASPAKVVIERAADLRYRGQAYELSVELAPGAPNFRELCDGFHAEHERTYGYRSEAEPVELVNLKVVARVPLAAAVPSAASAAHDEQARASRDVYYGPGCGIRSTLVGSRRLLADGPVEGPLIIEEVDATCVIPPACRASLDAFGNIDIEVHASP